jgi:23S rRNA (pseudouridine1915-N3)-methyltransferase
LKQAGTNLTLFQYYYNFSNRKVKLLILCWEPLDPVSGNLMPEFMKLALLQTGKTSEKYIENGINNFSTRIMKYSVFEIITIPDTKNTKNMPVAEQQQKEGSRILQSLNREDYVVLLDEKGKELRTVEFADLLQKMLMLQKKRIVFVIGGAWGFSSEVYARADIRISLSRMTFSHQVVRLLFLEQLYRAFTILKGDPYHHE